MDKKIDLRVIKTKKNLYNSLLILMGSMPFEDIKVSDICDKSLINRSTFYAHFSDKYELLHSLISDLKEELVLTLEKNQGIENPKDYYMKMIELFLTHIDDNINAYKAIINNNKDSIVMDMVTDTLTNDIKNKLKKEATGKIPVEFISKFYIGAVISVGIEYLRNPKANSKEKVIEYLNQLLPDKIY